MNDLHIGERETCTYSLLQVWFLGSKLREPGKKESMEAEENPLDKKGRRWSDSSRHLVSAPDSQASSL